MYQKLAQITRGSFCVPEDPQQVHHFFAQQVPPPINYESPVVKAEGKPRPRVSAVYEMGFPVQKEEENVRLQGLVKCSCRISAAAMFASVASFTSVPDVTALCVNYLSNVPSVC